MRVLPLTPEITELLYNQNHSLRHVHDAVMMQQPPSGCVSFSRVISSEINLFLQHLEQAFDAAPLLKPFFSRIVAFGPKEVDTNLLACGPDLNASLFPLNAALKKYYARFIHAKGVAEKAVTEEGVSSSASVEGVSEKATAEEGVSSTTVAEEGVSSETPAMITGSELSSDFLSLFYSSLVSGFKLACEAGPLCGELLWGVLFILEDVSLLPKDAADAPTDETVEAAVEAFKSEAMEKEEAMARLSALNSGMVMSACKQLCHAAYSQASARIAEPMYRCVLQCGSEHLGKLYSVLNQRRGEVLNEDIWEGTDIFTITCVIPVTESLGLANDLRQQTSGAVGQPQLQFSHWSVLDEDPFSKPTTEEEIEEWGESFATKNKAYQIVTAIRKRKGMQTEEKIVENAEKQRTMKSKSSVCCTCVLKSIVCCKEMMIERIEETQQKHVNPITKKDITHTASQRGALIHLREVEVLLLFLVAEVLHHELVRLLVQRLVREGHLLQRVHEAALVQLLLHQVHLRPALMHDELAQLRLTRPRRPHRQTAVQRVQNDRLQLRLGVGVHQLANGRDHALRLRDLRDLRGVAAANGVANHPAALALQIRPAVLDDGDQPRHDLIIQHQLRLTTHTHTHLDLRLTSRCDVGQAPQRLLHHRVLRGVH